MTTSSGMPGTYFPSNAWIPFIQLRGFEVLAKISAPPTLDRDTADEISLWLKYWTKTETLSGGWGTAFRPIGSNWRHDDKPVKDRAYGCVCLDRLNRRMASALEALN